MRPVSFLENRGFFTKEATIYHFLPFNRDSLLTAE
ncbi:MAG: hypothetical protein ACJAYR_001749 [Sneathiella sp.]|jgi:hypothetical protein